LFIVLLFIDCKMSNSHDRDSYIINIPENMVIKINGRLVDLRYIRELERKRQKNIEKNMKCFIFIFFCVFFDM
jgi:hypothetical protein